MKKHLEEIKEEMENMSVEELEKVISDMEKLSQRINQLINRKEGDPNE